MDLKEWAKIYVSSRDVLHQVSSSIEESGVGDFVVKRSSGDQVFVIRPVLSADNFPDTQSQLCIVTLNSRSNVNVLIEEWDRFVALRNVCVYFVNPSTNEKWLIFPFTHNQIIDRSSLRRGIESLFESIPSVDGGEKVE